MVIRAGALVTPIHTSPIIRIWCYDYLVVRAWYELPLVNRRTIQIDLRDLVIAADGLVAGPKPM